LPYKTYQSGQSKPFELQAAKELLADIYEIHIKGVDDLIQQHMWISE
jgi:hypothetical protein